MTTTYAPIENRTLSQRNDGRIIYHAADVSDACIEVEATGLVIDLPGLHLCEAAQQPSPLERIADMLDGTISGPGSISVFDKSR